MRARASIVRSTAKTVAKVTAEPRANGLDEIRLDVFVGGIDITLWMNIDEAIILSGDLIAAVRKAEGAG